MPDDFDDFDDDFDDDDSGGGAFLSRCTITTWGGTKKKQQQKGTTTTKLLYRVGKTTTTTTKRMRFWNTKSVTMAFDVASLKSFCCAWCFPDAKVVDACAHVSEQIAVVSIVFAMFALVKTEKVRAEEVLGWSVSCAVLGMMCMEDDDDDDDDDEGDDGDDKKKTKKKTEKKNRYVTLLKRRIRLGVGVALAVAISSPLFLTMTASVSDDTAVAVAGILAFVHLATHDYRVESTSLGNALEGVSLVSAIFSASLMASRLETVLDAFACALLAVGAFTMSMPLRRQWRRKQKSVATIFSAHGVAAWVLGKIEHTLMVAYCATIGLFLTVVPLSFAYARRTFKMKIEGPWAEAKPELNLMRSSVRRAGVPIFRHILANAPSRGSRRDRD